MTATIAQTAAATDNIVAFPTDVAVLQAQKEALLAAQKEIAKKIAEATRQQKQNEQTAQNAGRTAALSSIVTAVSEMLKEKGLTVADLRGSEAFKTFIGQDKREIRKMTPIDEKFITACLKAGIPVSSIATELDTAPATIIARKEKMVGFTFPVITAEKPNGDQWRAGDKGQWPESAKKLVADMIATIKLQIEAEQEAADEAHETDAPY